MQKTARYYDSQIRAEALYQHACLLFTFTDRRQPPILARNLGKLPQDFMTRFVAVVVTMPNLLLVLNNVLNCLTKYLSLFSLEFVLVEPSSTNP